MVELLRIGQVFPFPVKLYVGEVGKLLFNERYTVWLTISNKIRLVMRITRLNNEICTKVCKKKTRIIKMFAIM